MIFSSGTSLKFRVLGCLGWAAVSVLINIGGEMGTVIFGGWGESLPSGGIHIMIFSSGTSLKFRVLGCLGWAFVSVLINIGGETGTEN